MKGVRLHMTDKAMVNGYLGASFSAEWVVASQALPEQALECKPLIYSLMLGERLYSWYV